MPASRISVSGLGKLLNSVKQPIYVLDKDLTIVFLNQACREWLGEAAEALLGRRCAYHSSPAAGPDALAAGLCPPPAVLSGETSAAPVAVVAGDGKPSERLTRFYTVGGGAGGVLAIVAVVEPDGLPASIVGAGVSPAPAAGTAAPQVLHDRIRRFRQEAAVRYRADRLIGEGPAMRLARRQVELAAASRCGVLLVGPPGSGRQHLAAAIHYGASLSAPGATAGSSSSATRPAGGLMPLDCALLGADLLEAAGAAVARPGARGEPGTLLLHRVDELPAEVQVQLADLLQRRPLAWRLVATAAEPLRELSRRAKFRGDLAALLSTITIELPPLGDRRDDLPLLAQLFLEDCNAAAAGKGDSPLLCGAPEGPFRQKGTVPFSGPGPRQIGGFSAAALERLDAYAWPGNLDELAEVVAEAHRRAAGLEIGVGDLPERLHVAAQAAAHPRRTEETIVLDEYLGRVERELIRRALGRAKGNKAKAARLLGVTRPRLYRRMVQLGLG